MMPDAGTRLEVRFTERLHIIQELRVGEVPLYDCVPELPDMVDITSG